MASPRTDSTPLPQRTPRAARIAAALIVAILVAACGGGSTDAVRPDEVVTVDFTTTPSFSGQRFPALSLAIGVSSGSSYGTPVVVTTTVDGRTVTSPAQVDEGTRNVCATATSASGVQAVTCRAVIVQWPRLQGRVASYDATGIVNPAGVTLTIDDDAPISITSFDGRFSIPSTKALVPGTRMLFTADGAIAPALVRTTSVAALNVMLTPTQVRIPSCSVYGGDVVPIDLDAAFMPIAANQSGYFDRATTVRTTSRVIVASWDVTSIPVALSDTGSGKRFTATDSSEVLAALSILTAHVCQGFRFAPLAEARANGVVVVKDPAFGALGAHSMGLPTTRGDYQRAEVVVRTLTPSTEAQRDSTRRTVMHEFLHVLGFGHTCSWPSVMTTGTICAAGTYTTTPSRQDVAHYFAMRYARQGERALFSTTSLAPAYVAALIAKGQSELPLLSYFVQP